jgi:hypothetical protein
LRPVRYAVGQNYSAPFRFCVPRFIARDCLDFGRERGGQPFSVGENNFSGIRLIAEAMKTSLLQLTRAND